MNESKAPRTIGKYEITGILGRGSMGMVYKAQDPQIGRTVAVKVLRSFFSGGGAGGEAALERFQMEARSAGNLRHPHIITVFEVNREGETPYIVMDFIEGETLDTVIARRGRLPPDALIRYASQIASGLDYAHKKNVVHRDIKPSNVLVDRSDNVFILDFGVANMGDGTPRPGEPVVGTPGYMSPEQILNEPIDGRADLFSLAIICFEALAGERPFPGNDFTSVIGNILAGRRAALHDFVPELPLGVEAVFERALARNRDERYSTGEELVAALREAVARIGPTQSRKLQEPYRPAEPIQEEWQERPVAQGLVHVELPKSPMKRSLALFGGALLLSTGLVLLAASRRGPPKGEEVIEEVQRGDVLVLAASASLKKPLPLDQVSDADLTTQIGREREEVQVSALLREVLKRKLISAKPSVIALTGHPSYSIRRAAAETLAGFGDGDASELLSLLRDRDPQVRATAAALLGTVNGQGVAQELFRHSLRENVPFVRDACLRSVELLRVGNSEHK